MHISEAVVALTKQLSLSEEFATGAKKIASFFRASEEHLSPGELLCALLGDQVSRKMQEYIIFSILDVGVSDFDLMKSLKRLHHLERLFGRLEVHPHTLNELELEIIQTFNNDSPVKNINDLIIAKQILAQWMDMFVHRQEPGQNRRAQLALLYKCEARALRARSNWLSDRADTYNMKTMIRLLPLISVCDETAKMIIDLGESIEKGNMPGAPVLSFELTMKTDAFEKWLKVISRQPACALFVQVINEQRKKKIPNRLLAAVSTLTRALQGENAMPLSWIAQAVGSCTNEAFQLDAGSRLPVLTPLLNQSGASFHGSNISGNFLENSFAQLIGDDNLTRCADDSRELTIREMVGKCMKKDTLLLRLLDNPKVYNSPGLVQRIASSSHSLMILQKIAFTRELHTGQANGGVPLALLKNPSNIPLTLLRPFLNVRYISIFEMKDLVRSPYGIRREIYEEVKAIVERRR